MTIQPEHRALIFVGAVALLGAGVRVTRAVGGPPRAAAQPALEHQMQAADSAAKATQLRKQTRGQGGPASKPTCGARGARGDTGSAVASRRHKSGGDNARSAPKAPLDRTGYVGDKLDLDVATAAQIDSLPGVSSAMAKRIVVDRIRRGPFLNADGMRRVIGVGPRFLGQIDSLVTFSGTFVSASASDTIIPPRSAAHSASRRGRTPPN